mgnify:CR=1 FL=1
MTNNCESYNRFLWYGVVAAVILHYEIYVYRYIDSVPALVMRLERSWLQIQKTFTHREDNFSLVKYKTCMYSSDVYSCT